MVSDYLEAEKLKNELLEVSSVEDARLSSANENMRIDITVTNIAEFSRVTGIPIVRK